MRKGPSFAALILLLACPLGAEAPVDWRSVPAREAPAWARGAVIYEIFPRQFSETGNFAGITARLDELRALGVDVLWLMPIHPVGRLKAKGSLGSPYAVRDYYAVNPDYGSKEDLHRLVDGAHARGMRVLIDIVANHTAWDSVMMSHPAYYKQDGAGNVVSPHPGWADVAGLDYSKPETRRYMIAMMEYWVREFRLDGFRCDVAAEVPTDFWEELRADLDRVRPGVFLLAESDKPELLRKAFDADYAWKMMATVNKVLMEGAPASEVRSTWEQEEQAAFPRGSLHMRCTDNHDEARAVSRYGWNGALASSVMMLTLDGIPLLYNGMEVGDSTESGDPALFERVPVFWHPKQRDAFRPTYAALIALRHGHPALTTGSVVWLENSAPENVVSFLRRSEAEETVTLVNFSNRPQAFSVSAEGAEKFSVLLAPGPGPSGTARLPDVKLGAFGWLILGRTIGQPPAQGAH